MIRINDCNLPLGMPRKPCAGDCRSSEDQRCELLDFNVFQTASYDARKKNSEITFVYIIDVTLRSP